MIYILLAYQLFQQNGMSMVYKLFVQDLDVLSVLFIGKTSSNLY